MIDEDAKFREWAKLSPASIEALLRGFRRSRLIARLVLGLSFAAFLWLQRTAHGELALFAPAAALLVFGPYHMRRTSDIRILYAILGLREVLAEAQGNVPIHGEAKPPS